MALYTRHQLLLLFTLLAAGGVGLGVREWRAAYPALAERLEQFDREPSSGEGQEADARAHREHRRIDLNAATDDDLRRLPGVGPVLAARILETRARRGRFGGLDDLRQVKGLRAATLERLRPLVTIGE